MTVEQAFENALNAEREAATLQALGDHHAAKAYRMQAEGWLEEAIELSTKEEN